MLDRSGLSTIALRSVDEVGLVCDGPASADAAMAGALSLPIARLLLRPVPEEGHPPGSTPPPAGRAAAIVRPVEVRRRST